MRIATASLTGVSRYSQSKYINPALKERDETHADFEKRIWRERIHCNADGFVVLPPMQFKRAVAVAAQYKSEQIPGKGKATYTKHVKSGVMCTEPIVTPVRKDDMPGEWLLLSPPTSRGSVEKCMPYLDEWEGQMRFLVFDDCIPEDVFERTLIDAGNFIGVGRFRPGCGGFYGRFRVEVVEWE